MKKTIIISLIIFSSKTLIGQSVEKYSNDVVSQDAIIEALYDVISGSKGKARDWDRMRYLFAENGQLIPTRTKPDGSKFLQFWSVQEYISNANDWLVENGFFEKEISRKTERYGSLVHIFSTYESRNIPGDKPFARGINSIQLMDDGIRWWIVNIYWLGETDENPLPVNYLE